ncbi:sugar ABC transporter substrate-binding protein [Reticulibacter mediterranei]|uniref:Sugar ABC transporter substrate-binding protein n=1 Tax=Reticulibacter mediterranei TaxID=2778369 RepID=A0A8J3II15_9CHLR|nr:extracellular solute-binding protein [Reticulibacter mediterranei]GHO94946.1 sugar ABC transporter substrate-binding protein [Reticulibacter mediterranei]
MDTERPQLQKFEKQDFSRRSFLKGAGATSAAALSVGGISSLLAACGGSSGSSGGASGAMQFWNFYAPGGSSKQQAQWFVSMVDAWNKANKSQIKLTYITDYTNGSKLQTSFASGQGPDLFLISPGDFLRYYNGGVLKDLTPYIDKSVQDDFYPDVIATRQVDGKIYGIPMEVEPMAFYYSVDAFEKAGLNENDVPKTWDELLEVGAKLKTAKRYGILFETTPGYYQNFTWYPFLWQAGGEVVDPNTKKSGFNSEAAVKALKLWQDAVKRGIAPRTTVGTGGSDIVANMNGNYAAIVNCGIWGISAMRESAPKFKYGVFKLPIPTGGKDRTIGGGWAFCANAKGPNAEEAAKFCAWALASAKEDSIQRGVDWIIKAKSDIGPRKSVMDAAAKDGGFSNGPMKIFKDEIAPGVRGEPRYPPEVYKPVSDAIQACMLNGADPQQQAENAAKTIDTFLSGYSGAPMF